MRDGTTRSDFQISGTVTILLLQDQAFGTLVQVAQGIAEFLATSAVHWKVVDRRGVVRSRWRDLVSRYRPAGIICVAGKPEDAAEIQVCGVPTVFVVRSLWRDRSTVGPDNVEAARLVADHFRECGLMHYAVAGNSMQLSDSELRYAFTEVVAPARILTPSYPRREEFERWPLPRVLEFFAGWLRGLPKPIGIFCLYDDVAHALIDAAAMAEVAIPDDVAVVAVGNSDSCGLRYNSLSSIDLNAHVQGYLASDLLRDILATTHPPAPQHRLVHDLRLVVRRSSDLQPTGDDVVARALGFIRINAGRQFLVADIAKTVSVSRRQLERRFRARLGRSLADETWRQRLRLAEGLLAGTDLPMKSVAGQSGFRSAGSFCHVFRRRTGMSPCAYREQRRG